MGLTHLNVDPVIQMAYVGIQLIFKIPLAINMGQVQACKPWTILGPCFLIDRFLWALESFFKILIHMDDGSIYVVLWAINLVLKGIGEFFAYSIQLNFRYLFLWTLNYKSGTLD